MLSAIILILGSNSIVSQNTSNTSEPEFFNESRPIKYRQLNEVLKLAEFQRQADIRDSIQKRQLAIQDSIIKSQENIITRYENKLIPNLQSQLALFQQQSNAQTELNTIRDEKWQLKYDKLKSRRLGLGGYIGYGGAFDGFSVKALPSIGFSIHYTIIRL
jgi:hypothetical protein